MNVAQRVDSFKFEELIGMKPLLPPAMRPDEHPEDHAPAVKRELMTREREIHSRLASHRIGSGRRANANEWFRLDDELIRVLFEERLDRGPCPRSADVGYAVRASAMATLTKVLRRPCYHCGLMFEPTRPHQIHCKPSCRMAAFKARTEWPVDDLFRVPFE